jgi:hypothetical protein
MGSRQTKVARWLGVAMCLLASAAICQAQGNFTVDKTDVPKLKLNHYFPLPEKKFHEPDFEWTFKKDTFTVKQGKGKIPAELVKLLLADTDATEEITGKWDLKDGKLVLTHIGSGKHVAQVEAKFTIYKTAPTVIRFGHGDKESQYVFAIQ